MLDEHELNKSDFLNPHLKEFIVQDDATTQRLFKIIENPPTVKQTRKRKLHFAIKKEFNMLFDMLISQKGNSEMTKDITDELDSLRTAALAVTTLLEVQKGLITQDEAHDRLKELGFTINEISWIQGELDRIIAKYKEDENER